MAAQYLITRDDDAVIRAVPGQAELDRVHELFPDTVVALKVQPGDRLSELPHQDSYRYLLAVVYAGDRDRAALEERLRRIEEILTFEMEAVAAERNP